MLRPMIKRASMNSTNAVIISRAITILAITPPYGQFQKKALIEILDFEIFLIWDPTQMASFLEFKE